MRAVTFLLTEVVGSVERWEEDEAAMAAATERLDSIVVDLVAAHRGTLVKPRGEGDSHFLTFDDPADAVACAVALQRAVADEPLLPLRSGCNVGAAEMRGGDWYGTTVNRCARLRAAAHARQALVSAEVADALGSLGRRLDGVTLRSLGRHRLKDLDEPAEVFQLCAPGLVEEHPPLSTLAMSHGLPLPRSSFVGRDSELASVVGLLHDRRVVTLTGAPGVGRTRLALEAAAAWWDREGHPVRLLSAPTSVDAVTAARRSAGELLVVDDAGEELRGAVVPGPALITAAGPLGVEGEAVVRLSPLDEFDSAHLLHERLSDEVVLPPGLVGYCDGLPLAIELLARRASSVDADVLARRLSAHPLAVLGGDRRADPPRHASMKATFDAAFQRLEPDARSELLAAAPGDPRWAALGWHEPEGPIPLIAAFLDEQRRAP